jgi:hypothetical protein
MCESCDNWDGEKGPGIDAALIPAARAIEAAMPGEPAADEAWAIFAGTAGGGISWADYQRISTSYEEAERAAAGPPTLGRKRGTSFRGDLCEAAIAARLG